MSSDGPTTKRPAADSGSDPLEQLRTREELLTEAERMMHVGSYLWEPGRSTLWSDEFFRILGHEPGTVACNAETFFAAVHPDDLDRLRGGWESSGRGDIPDFEFRLARQPSGEVRYVRCSGQVYRDADGTVTRLVGAILDITESKRNALALEEALTVARAAEQLASVGSFVVQIEPLEIHLSEGLRQLTGLDAGPRDPSAHRAVVHPDDLARQLEWWYRLLDRKVVEPLQVRLVRPDGQLRHVYTHASVMPFRSDGIERVVGTTIDITERVLLEEELRHAAKLEAVGTLAAGVAHDFNNYLMVVTSALERMPHAVDSDARTQLQDNAQRAVSRCIELTRQLLGFARGQSFAPDLVDVCTVLDAFQELFRQSLGRRAELRIVREQRPLLARLDARQLEQMLANLVVNAADAIEASGKGPGVVRIVAEQLQLDTALSMIPDAVGPGRFTRICVEDDGGGIAPELLPRIFEPYFTTKPRGRGTGLGLSSVYGMARQNGGVVTVEAIAGGTRFALWFPVAVAPASQPVALVERNASQPWRILVVEDVPELLRATLLSLRDAGFDAFEAAGAEAALTLLDQTDVDLVLTDVQMPGMDGRALARVLRQRSPGLRIALMTGHHGQPSAAPVDPELRVLQKPFAEHELLDFVRETLV